MLQIVLRKMFNNPWMTACLLAGSILATALTSCIPLYTASVLQRMMTRDLENYQIEMSNFPGSYRIDANFYFAYEEFYRSQAFEIIRDEIENNLARRIKLPVLASTRTIFFENLSMLPIVRKEAEPKKEYVDIGAIADIRGHIKILHGRMFSRQKNGNVYEAMVTEKAMKEKKLLLNEVYAFEKATEDTTVKFNVKIVGVFTMKDPDDLYWYNGTWQFDDCFMLDYNLCTRDFITRDKKLITGAKWNYAFDYHKINLENIKTILKEYEEQKRWFSENPTLDFRMPAVEILEKYREREKQLVITLWVILVPVLLMLAFYVFMVSQLIINQEQNEIAVIKSRGASRLQVFTSYLIESLVLSLIAIILGPPLGLLICKMLGFSNGFLEFVQRTALPVKMGFNAYAYSFGALALFIILMLAPVILSSKASIVLYKQKKARSFKAPFWKRYFLDVVILAIAGYGRYRYQDIMKVLKITEVKGTDISTDWLLFVTSTLFIIGAGLVFLRIYPYMIRLMFIAGRKFWTPVFYASFIQVGRSGGKEQFLMLFIILALSTGIFNANTARTLNRNIEDKIRYATGADVAIMPHWESNKQKDQMSGMAGIGGQMPDMGSGSQVQGGSGTGITRSEPLKYYEPDFQQFKKLKGVDEATKVFINKNGRAQIGDTDISRVQIMGINPYEFGKVAWFRNDLLPYHWYQYLNLMVNAPKAFLASRSFKEKYKARVGDRVYITWGDQGFLEGTIYAFVHYWPAYNPSIAGEEDVGQDLIVANLSYIHSRFIVEPYEIWIGKSPGATDTVISEDIKEKKLKISSVNFAGQELIKKKNDPMLQGTNGALTLGFVIIMTISLIGFLIYWILSIRNRELQFGIFRAMGLSLRKVKGMLICEQIMISGTAVVIGILIGGIASELFVPMLQIVYSSADQVPPFKVVASGSDYLKVYAVVAIMLTAGFIILGRLVSGIKIDRAIKLGED